MEIRNISNGMPQTGIRPGAEQVPVLQSAQNGEQVTAAAIRQPAESQAPVIGKKATDPEWKVGKGTTDDSQKAGLPADAMHTKEAMEGIAQSLQSVSRSSGLQFAVDDELGRVVVKVVDPETQEVIKQFPSEDAIRLSKSLGKLSGSLHQEKA